MKGTPLLLIASLALGACSLGPDFTRPDRPAPGEWSLRPLPATPATSPPRRSQPNGGRCSTTRN